MKTFGLIGFPLSHSFSQKYFSEKFKKEHILDAEYKLFPIEIITDFPSILQVNPTLVGLNVTIPYKEAIIPYLTELDETASVVGAVNTIKIISSPSNQLHLKGFNTDVYGFRESLKPILKSNHQKALILGTGGAAKAVEFVLKQIGIDCFFVSREKKSQIINHKSQIFAYEELTKNIISYFHLVINTTPIGMYPNTNACPNIPYEHLTENHLLYDLVYNPEETLFLKNGKTQGSAIQNGLTMLHFQAEKAWEIWSE